MKQKVMDDKLANWISELMFSQQREWEKEGYGK